MFRSWLHSLGFEADPLAQLAAQSISPTLGSFSMLASDGNLCTYQFFFLIMFPYLTHSNFIISYPQKLLSLCPEDTSDQTIETIDVVNKTIKLPIVLMV